MNGTRKLIKEIIGETGMDKLTKELKKKSIEKDRNECKYCGIS